MKKITAILFASLLFLSSNAYAANIAVIDVEEVIKNSLAMKDIQNQITKMGDRYQKEVNQKQKELEAAEKELDKNKTVFSKEKMEKETKDLEKKFSSLREFIDKKQNILKKASMDAMAKFNEKVGEITTKISKEKNLDLILIANQTIYYKPDMDISDEVLKELNKKITKLNLKFE